MNGVCFGGNLLTYLNNQSFKISYLLFQSVELSMWKRVEALIILKTLGKARKRLALLIK